MNRLIDDLAMPPSAASASRSKGRLLLVDDSHLVRTGLSRELGSSYDLRLVDNGETAWQTLLLDEQIVLAITDLSMPQLDGWGLVERIRRSRMRRLRGLPIVVLTATEDAKERQRALDLGADAYFSKGDDPSRLTETVERLLLERAQPSHKEVDRRAKPAALSAWAFDSKPPTLAEHDRAAQGFARPATDDAAFAAFRDAQAAAPLQLDRLRSGSNSEFAHDGKDESRSQSHDSMPVFEAAAGSSITEGGTLRAATPAEDDLPDAVVEQLTPILSQGWGYCAQIGADVSVICMRLDPIKVGPTLERFVRERVSARLMRHLNASIRRDDQILSVRQGEVWILASCAGAGGAVAFALRLLVAVVRARLAATVCQLDTPLTASFGIVSLEADRPPSLENAIRIAHQRTKAAQQEGAGLIVAANQVIRPRFDADELGGCPDIPTALDWIRAGRMHELLPYLDALEAELKPLLSLLRRM